eukprot:TRINITY_DN19273_c0_g1_i1.p1 TRINITY_DN19273_c0_g1~~TRINITY_DN19273_c0_g1_i1.p1  ORF type:complete len:325 (+),score=86.34 TRINITY_DN19273_c0_g1_i1:73-975(+)
MPRGRRTAAQQAAASRWAARLAVQKAARMQKEFKLLCEQSDERRAYTTYSECLLRDFEEECWGIVKHRIELADGQQAERNKVATEEAAAWAALAAEWSEGQRRVANARKRVSWHDCHDVLWIEPSGNMNPTPSRKNSSSADIALQRRPKQHSAPAPILQPLGTEPQGVVVVAEVVRIQKKNVKSYERHFPALPSSKGNRGPPPAGCPPRGRPAMTSASKPPQAQARCTPAPPRPTPAQPQRKLNLDDTTAFPPLRRNPAPGGSRLQRRCAGTPSLSGSSMVGNTKNLQRPKGPSTAARAR